MDPSTRIGDDSRPNPRPIYLYVVQQIDVAGSPVLFLTGHDQEIEVSGCPARYGPEATQVFTPARIGHGPIRRDGQFDKTTFEVSALTRDITGISRYALTGAVPRIRVDIVKINPGPVAAGEIAEWAGDCFVAQTGLISRFTFQGFSIQAECIPEPLFSQHEIPRWRFSRTCNRQLYAPDCGVVELAYSMATNIVSINAAQRTMLLTDQHVSETGDFFRQGVLLHQPTGMRFSVFSSAIEGTGTRVRIHQWSPDFAPTDVVVLRAGCRHSMADCHGKFANAANFGGFSEVPNKNATIHGV